jgi:hypothetical protein
MHLGGRHMYNDVTLGKFSYNLGGSIYLAPSENMKFGWETSSCMHELYHANLALSSNVGLLMHLIELEINLEQQDYNYKKELQIKQRYLYEATREVQEVYANTLELLWIQEYYGDDARDEIYNNKTDEYKKYLSISESMWLNNTNNIHERRKQVHDICRSVLNVNLFDNKIWILLNDCVKENSELHLFNIFHENLCSSFEKGRCIIKSMHIDQNEILQLSYNRFRHVGDKFELAIKNVKNVEDANLTNLLLENVCTFEFNELKIKRGKKYDSRCDAICLIHNIDTKAGKLSRCIIQYFCDEKKYELVEVRDNALNDIMKDREFVIIPYEEFSFRENRPKYDDFCNKIVFVLINNAKDFKQWVGKIHEYEEIYIGDISKTSSDNFFTVIYFRKRNCDNIIFMFPSLKIIVKNIFEELNIMDQVCYPGKGKMGFYNIFSVFNGWGEILKALKETVSFITNSKGNILHNQNPCSKIIETVKYDIGDNIFKINGKNYFLLNSVFPTLQTEAMPFWILMEFIDGENSGNIKTETSEDRENSGTSKTGVLYFYTKDQADLYLKKMIMANCKMENFKSVGLDELFWRNLSPYLKSNQVGMIYVTGENSKGIWNSVDQFEFLRMKEIKKK